MKDWAKTMIEYITLGTMVIGGIVWLTSMFNQTRSNAQDIGEIKVKTESNVLYFRTIERSLGRMEGKIDTLLKK